MSFVDAIQRLEQRLLFATYPANFSENLMGSAITNGTNMAFAPDGRLFVSQQGGALRVIDHGVLQATPFVTVTTTSTGERGLLGIAFDPDYFNNHFVYVYYTVSSAPIHNRVSRFTADPNNQNVAVAGSEVQLLNLPNLSATNHNGGAIHFGSDGKLYIAVGENAVGANAQSFSTILGKMLRMNTDGSIPTDNPYFLDPTVTGQNKLIWALGLRNPFTFAFQNGTGRMFINDVGEVTWEEINDGIAHSNYGWNLIEGFSTGSPTPPADYRDPLSAYDHTAFPNAAIIGGAFYNPVYNTYPASYTDQYFFGDLNNSFIKTMDPTTHVVSPFATGTNTISSMTLGPDGSVYYIARSVSQGAFRIKYLDTTAPIANTPSFVFDEAKPTFGTAQRLRMSFNEYVGDSLTPSDLTIVNQTTGVTIPTANISMQYDTSTNTANFSFPGFADANGALPDGNYTVTVSAASVTDVQSNALAGGINFSFFALNGDFNRDRHVDAADQAILTAHLAGAGTYAQGDMNYDGTVTAADQTILSGQLKLWLPPQGSLALPATGGDDAYVLKRESAALLDVTANADVPPTYRIYTGAITTNFFSFSGGAGNDSLTLDYSNGALMPAGITINFDGGANTDTFTVIGSTAADSVTFSASGNMINGANVIATNHETVRFDGLGGFDTMSTFSGPTVTIFNPQHFAALNVNSSSSAAAEQGNAFIVTNALTVSPGAKLDLNDNDLLLDYTSGGPQIGTIQGWINTARGLTGTWTGNGITSSTAKNKIPANTTLGAMEATDYASISGATAFDGEPIDNTAVLIKYTYYGDANFNGRVDGGDYGRIDFTFGQEGTMGNIGGWLNGDFNGDGKVNGSDYALIDFAFGTQDVVLRPIASPTGGRGRVTGKNR